MKRIAIIKLGALGDVVRTTILLKPLQALYPNAEIWWFTASSAKPLLERNPCIQKILTVDTNAPVSIPNELFDLVFGLDEDRLACHLASLLKAQKRIGAYEESPKHLRYTEDSKGWFEMGLLNRDPDGGLKTANALKKKNKKTYPEFLLEMAGIPADRRADARPIIVPDPQAEDWARDWAKAHQLHPSQGVVGLNTGAGHRWTSKQMPIAKTVELARTLKKMNSRILLLGGREEVERNRTLLDQLGDTVIDTGTDNSLVRFISLINLCESLVTSDSLALHLGSALGKIVMPFFSCTSVAEIDVYDQGFKWLPRSACSCFYDAACRREPFCLETLAVEDLTSALTRCLETAGRTA